MIKTVLWKTAEFIRALPITRNATLLSEVGRIRKFSSSDSESYVPSTAKSIGPDDENGGAPIDVKSPQPTTRPKRQKQGANHQSEVESITNSYSSDWSTWTPSSDKEPCASYAAESPGPTEEKINPPPEAKSDKSSRPIRQSHWVGSTKAELLDVAGKVAIITGGCTGVGLATAAELLRHHVKHLVLTGSEPGDGADALHYLHQNFTSEYAARAKYLQLDVTDSRQFEDVFRQTLLNHQRLHLVINAATMMDDSRWEYEVDTNINGLVRGTLLGFRYMGHHPVALPSLGAIAAVRPHDDGSPVVINLACVVGLDPLAGAPIYSLTQSAVVALTRSLGAPFHAARTGVRVLCLCSGITSDDALLDDDPHLGHRLLDCDWSLAAQEQLKTMPVQDARAAAQAALFLARHGPSGTVWMVEDAELARIEFPQRRDISQRMASFK